MSDSNPTPFPNPFAMMMPGLDAMRQWAGVGSTPGTPPGWVAPTVNVEDLDKRIQELKVVQYWLEQNARMIAATVQGLEVQKMTLTTLQSMNVQADELAKALQVQPQDMMAAWAKSVAPKRPEPEFEPPPEPTPQPPEQSVADDEAAKPAEASAPAGADPVQWWGALNQQFQTLASQAAQDWQQQAQRAQAQVAAAHGSSAAAPEAPSSAASAGADQPKAARKTRATPRSDSTRRRRPSTSIEPKGTARQASAGKTRTPKSRP